MTVRDKLEIGLKEDAPYRRDNLPDEQVEGPEQPAGPGRSPVVPEARRRAEDSRGSTPPRRRSKRRAPGADRRRTADN